MRSPNRFVGNAPLENIDEETAQEIVT
jgi:hypothetical protein